MATQIEFWGGAGTVTGSKTLVSNGKHKILVDCGLFQGLKELRLLNWSAPEFDCSKLSAVILTHAHLDHTGYLPLLVRAGFQGPIFCTTPTQALARLILLDSARLQEEDAELANQLKYSKHSPAKPLYTSEEVYSALKLFKTLSPLAWHELFDGIRLRLSPNGHILGSTFVEMDFDGRRWVFSGDIGRQSPLLLKRPTVIEEADILVVESTYGDRNHSPDDVAQRLTQIIESTSARGGHVIIPAFAVGRTQDLLYILSQLKKSERISDVPVYLDTPMGADATEIFLRNPEWHTLGPDAVKELSSVARTLVSRSESEAIVRKRGPGVVIAGSGMVTGGRVLHHLEARLSDERNTVVLVGYQALGTRGRSLRARASEIKFHGRFVPVKAHIESLDGLSAHGDQSEILTWLRGFKKTPKHVFINHGEPQASQGLRLKIQNDLGWNPQIAHYAHPYLISAD